MTSEGTKETQQWIADKKAKFAYAYDPTAKLSRFFQVGGLPSAGLIDAQGIVVWTGHPGDVTEAMVEDLVKGALTMPLWEWPAAAKSVKQAYLQQRYAGAIEAALQLGERDGGPALAASLQAQVEGIVSGLEQGFEKGNLLAVEDQRKVYRARFGTLPQVARIESLLARLDAHSQAAAILSAQRKFRKLREDPPTKRKEIEKTIEELRLLANEFPRSQVQDEAEALIRRLTHGR